VITSKSNEQIKLCISLKNKKYREKYSKYLIEGIKLVGEMIDSEWGKNSSSEFIIYSPEIVESLNNGKELIDKIHKCKVKALDVSKEIYNLITDTETPQGVAAVVNMPTYTETEIIQNIKKSVTIGEQFLVLDKIQDAGNLGTIIRTAVTFGISNIICLKGTVDVYSPKVVRSTMGAIQKLNIFYVDEEIFINLSNILKDNGYILVGTHLKATEYLHELKQKQNRVFVMGNEANGMSENITKACDKLVKIPMEETQESLNVAIATSICLYDSYLNR